MIVLAVLLGFTVGALTGLGLWYMAPPALRDRSEMPALWAGAASLPACVLTTSLTLAILTGDAAPPDSLRWFMGALCALAVMLYLYGRLDGAWDRAE